jgi:hypothetical protein
MFKTTFAALALLLLAAPAQADGCNPRHQDCGGYKDGPAPARRAYSYQAAPLRGWACPPEFTRRECRRIQAEREARRRVASYTPRRQAAARYVDDSRPVRVRSASRCGPYIAVKGDARWTEGLARGSALKEWRKQVRLSLNENYVDERYAQGFTVGKCRIIGDRGINKRCTAEGRPCQP